MHLSPFWKHFAAAPLLFLFSTNIQAQTINTLISESSTAWMMLSTVLVIMMSVPGLALFYGGLVRSKNILSTLVQVWIIFTLIIVLWCIYGYSLAFTENTPFIGSFLGPNSRLFLSGIIHNHLGTFSPTETLTKGVAIPELLYVVFQGTFAAIACALIIGSLVERVKFVAILLFIVLWFTFSYLPIAHMVWSWPGPDNIIDTVSLAQETEKAGWLWQQGALDFAGGTVVHINAAVAGLIGAWMLGPRLHLGKQPLPPHSLPLTMAGAALLWVGWFGFNAGSALAANDIAALAFLNTLLAPATAALTWAGGEWLIKGKPSLLGVVSGSISGLVAITPACGYVGPLGALIIGGLSGLVCLWGVNGLKHRLHLDDALDVFGVHGIGGILGALLTGVFASPDLGGQGLFDYVTNKLSTEPYDIITQVLNQAEAVLVTIIWSAIVSLLAYKCVDRLVGLRVTEEEEREGLDITSHGESAYNK